MWLSLRWSFKRKFWCFFHLVIVQSNSHHCLSIDELKCVFAPTHVISLGQVNICLAVSPYEISVCLGNVPCPICHDTYCLAHPTGPLWLSCVVPFQVRNVLFCVFSSLVQDMLLDCVTWWKSINDGIWVRGVHIAVKKMNASVNITHYPPGTSRRCRSTLREAGSLALWLWGRLSKLISPTALEWLTSHYPWHVQLFI